MLSKTYHNNPRFNTIYNYNNTNSNVSSRSCLQKYNDADLTTTVKNNYFTFMVVGNYYCSENYHLKAKALIDAITQVKEEDFPFRTTIIEENERYKFT